MGDRRTSLRAAILQRTFQLLLALLLGCLSLPAYGATYYVAKTGSDGNPGTLTQPWLTIGKAAATLVAGDTVYVRGGTYPERIIPLNSGAPSQYITYAAYPGEAVTIDGASQVVPRYGALFDMALKNYLQVSGFRVINSTDQGILADGSTGIVIKNNYTYNTVGSGIASWNSNNVIIDGNEVERGCTGIYNECISVGGTNSFEVKNNHVHHAGNPVKEGICAKDGSSNGKVYGNRVHDTRQGIYVDAWDKHTYNIEVYGNNVYNNNDTGILMNSEQGGLLENIKIYNNISYNNIYMGIHVGSCCIATHPMNNISIINNTCYQNGTTWGYGINIENPQAQNVVVRNNICSQNLSQLGLDALVNPANCTIDHNLIDGTTDIYGAAYVQGDPKLVDPARGDFHLRAGSPAIDTGSSVGAPWFDYAGNSRPMGRGFDIGAYEFRPYLVGVDLLLWD